MAAGDLNVFAGLWDLELVYADASETRQDVVYRGSKGALLGDSSVSGAVLSQADPRKLPILAKTAGHLSEDDKLIVKIKDNTAETFDNADNDAEMSIRIPITIRNVKTEVLTETELMAKDFSGSDVLMIAGEWTKVLTYTVSAQEEVKIGHAVAENSRIFASPLLADAAA